MEFATAVTLIATAIQLLDSAIKDRNYNKAKQLQNRINDIAAKANMTVAQLNKELSKYTNRYSEAVSLLSNSTRGSVQYDKGLKDYDEARSKIKTINTELSDKTKQAEKAQALLNQERSHYDNQGIVSGLSSIFKGE